MARFILLSFAFMGWGFYELSGGSEFDPVVAREALIEERMAQTGQTAEQDPARPTEAAPKLAVADDSPQVTRIALNLTTLNDVLDPPKARSAKPSVDATRAAALTQAPTIILPSLIEKSEPDAGDPVALQPVSTSGADIRSVTGTTVNLRGGPGTDFSVIGKLSQGDAVEILEDTGIGWVQLRPVNGGPVGWMADFLLSGS